MWMPGGLENEIVGHLCRASCFKTHFHGDTWVPDRLCVGSGSMGFHILSMRELMQLQLRPRQLWVSCNEGRTEMGEMGTEGRSQKTEWRWPTGQRDTGEGV